MAKQKKQTTTVNIDDNEAALNILKSKYNVGEKTEVKEVRPEECLSTGSLQLDIAMNDGGIRPGSIIEYYGDYGTLKTWRALEMLREAQLKWPNKGTAYWDPEQAVDRYVAQNTIGVNFDDLLNGIPACEYWPDPEIHKIPTLEDILERMYDYASSGIFSFIVLDSVAASMTLWEEKSGSVTESKWGGPSIAMSKAMKRVKAACARTGCIVLCINQLRTTKKMTPRGEITALEPGSGMALRYAATHRHRVSWAEKDREGEGSQLNIFLDKVKFGRPWQTITLPITLGKGINKAEDIAMAAETYGTIEKRGSWIFRNGEQVCQGINQLTKLLENNPEFYNDLRQETLHKGLVIRKKLALEPEE